MGSALRASVPRKRAAAILFAVGLVLTTPVSHAIAQASVAGSAVAPAIPLPPTTATVRPATHASTFPPRTPRVLLIGDSVLDQQGSAATFLLRQAGVDARAVGLWGSGLLTVDQYDYGKTKRSGSWLHKAENEISAVDPDVVGVYLNHNYWEPFPHDAAGRLITDLWSRSGQRMIAQQAQVLITILRAHGARVFFIAPIPAGTVSAPDPRAWSPIWHAYLPVLHAMHVPVADTARPLEAANGLRAETRPSCDGSEERARPPNDLHLTRFGAGLAGTVLANYVATFVDAHLLGNAAPGDAAAALVPKPDGHGYWLVGCDGSVYHFGAASHVAGARHAVAGHGGVTAAVATPTGAGLWLITADGTIAPVGDATPLTFRRRPPSPITDATRMPGAIGLLATTGSGVVLTAGAARTYGHLGGIRLSAKVVGITATRGGGYLLVGADGGVFAFGDAQFRGSAASVKHNGTIVDIASTVDNRGYWLLGSDGGVLAFGDAGFHGSGAWHPQPYPYSAVNAVPGPAIRIVAAPGSREGYWILGTTGRVVNRGAAGRYGGDNNLALFTQ